MNRIAIQEEWRPVVGYEGLYEVSSLGRVRSLDRCVSHPHSGTCRRRGAMRCPVLVQGYQVVNLSRNGRVKALKVHRLVAAAFIGPCRGDKRLVLHTDGNKLNNVAENLRYGSDADNKKDSVRLAEKPRGEDNRQSKLTLAAVNRIRSGKEPAAVLAAEYGVSRESIWNVRKRLTWRYV